MKQVNFDHQPHDIQELYSEFVGISYLQFSSVNHKEERKQEIIRLLSKMGIVFNSKHGWIKQKETDMTTTTTPTTTDQTASQASKPSRKLVPLRIRKKLPRRWNCTTGEYNQALSKLARAASNLLKNGMDNINEALSTSFDSLDVILVAKIRWYAENVLEQHSDLVRDHIISESSSYIKSTNKDN